MKGDGQGNFINTPLELWAGFVGLKQNSNDFNLRPEIGWIIKKKDFSIDDKKLAGLRAKAENKNFGVELRVNQVPAELMQIGPIEYLNLEFIKEINIPDELGKVPIRKLRLRGTIDNAGIDRIKKLFPNTELIINMQRILQ
jgi:hypothetical protein